MATRGRDKSRPRLSSHMSTTQTSARSTPWYRPLITALGSSLRVQQLRETTSGPTLPLTATSGSTGPRPTACRGHKHADIVYHDEASLAPLTHFDCSINAAGGLSLGN